MRHLNEEQLILYHYGEATEDRAALAEHLGACPSCQARLETLEAVLAAVRAPVREPAPGFERQVWQRLEPEIAPRRPWSWPWAWAPRQWATAGAMAVLAVGSFLAGRYLPRASPARQAPVRAAAGEGRDRVFVVALGDHLDRSQMILIELANARTADDISAEQQLAEELLGANRLYRLTAANAGEKVVAEVLDELERVLLDIAHSPARLTAPQLEALRERIEEQGIVFKVRVIGSQLRERRGAS